MLVLNGKQSMKPQAICVCAVLQKTQKRLPSTAKPSLGGECPERVSRNAQQNLKRMLCFSPCSSKACREWMLNSPCVYLRSLSLTHTLVYRHILVRSGSICWNTFREPRSRLGVAEISMLIFK